MKKAKDYSGAKTLYFKPELKLCPNCDKPLHRSHVAWRKNIITLNGIFHVTSLAYKCSNTDCLHPETIYCSIEAETLSIKHYQFSLDGIAKTGQLRFKEHQTIRQIKRTLKKNFKLQISRSEVDLLYEAFLAFTTPNRQQDTKFLKKLKDNEGIILAMDEVQLEKGNETLWILKETKTGETLLAKNLESADKDIISDRQRSIRLAVAQEFPNVPHQLCHFHFLLNITKPISEMDRALKVDLKKKVRRIKPLERKAALESSEKTKMILQYCQVIRYALQEDGDYPLKPGGFRLYHKLRKIKQSIQRSHNLKAKQ